MWAITGKRAHADKAIHILDSWVASLKKVSGIDGVLASGLQGFMFVNGAELLRHTRAGWSEKAARRCGQWFRDVWDPTIEHYAYFANGNWETAALQTRMAIAVYCNDRQMFEETVRYAVAGAGNGSIPHMIVFRAASARRRRGPSTMRSWGSVCWAVLQRLRGTRVSISTAGETIEF